MKDPDWRELSHKTRKEPPAIESGNIREGAGSSPGKCARPFARPSIGRFRERMKLSCVKFADRDAHPVGKGGTEGTKKKSKHSAGDGGGWRVVASGSSEVQHSCCWRPTEYVLMQTEGGRYALVIGKWAENAWDRIRAQNQKVVWNMVL